MRGDLIAIVVLGRRSWDGGHRAMGNAQGNAANITAPPCANSAASKMAPPRHPAADDDEDYDAIADMAWAHVNDENQPPGAYNLGGNGKPVRRQSSGRGSSTGASPAPALRSTSAPASAKLKRGKQQAREEQDEISPSKRRRVDGHEDQACNDESRKEHREDVEEEDGEDENEDDSMIATMAWEALRSGSPTASVASSAWSGECKACRGHHRPHTCGKPKPASAKEECKACKGRKRAHTCGLEVEIAQKREQCKACRGKKRAHTCGKGTGETLKKGSVGKQSVSGGGMTQKTIKKGSVGKQASAAAAAAASSANAAKPKASKEKKKSGNKGGKKKGVDGDDAKAAEAAIRVMMQEEEEEEEEEEEAFSKTGRALKKSIKGKEAKRNAAANQSESESSGSESEGDDDDDDDDDGDDDAGSNWSHGMVKLLMKAYGRVRPDSSDFWGDVASGVPGKTAQECCDRYHAKFPTPGAIKGETSFPLVSASFIQSCASCS